jgi:multiple sugar transport system permease protein
MKDMLLFSAVMAIQGSFSAGAISAAMAGYPSVEYSADMIVQYMEDVGTIKYEMGYASAIAVVLFLMMIVARSLFVKVLDTTGK